LAFIDPDTSKANPTVNGADIFEYSPWGMPSSRRI
jgi:hypothetical protein